MFVLLFPPTETFRTVTGGQAKPAAFCAPLDGATVATQLYSTSENMLGGLYDGRLGSSSTRGTVFDMEPIRAYKGPRIDFDTAVASPFPRPADKDICERWAVLASIFEPTKTVNQLAELSGWCVVVVGDRNGKYIFGVKSCLLRDKGRLYIIWFFYVVPHALRQ